MGVGNGVSGAEARCKVVRVRVVIDRVCCLNPWWAIEVVSRLGGEYV